MGNHGTVGRAKNLAATISSGRRLFRLGKTIDYVKSLKSALTVRAVVVQR